MLPAGSDSGAWEQAAIGEVVSEWKERAALESADAREEAAAQAVEDNYSEYAPKEGRAIHKDFQGAAEFPAEASSLVATKHAILDGTQASGAKKLLADARSRAPSDSAVAQAESVLLARAQAQGFPSVSAWRQASALPMTDATVVGTSSLARREAQLDTQLIGSADRAVSYAATAVQPLAAESRLRSLSVEEQTIAAAIRITRLKRMLAAQDRVEDSAPPTSAAAPAMPLPPMAAMAAPRQLLPVAAKGAPVATAPRLLLPAPDAPSPVSGSKLQSAAPPTPVSQLPSPQAAAPPPPTVIATAAPRANATLAPPAPADGSGAAGAAAAVAVVKGAPAVHAVVSALHEGTSTRSSSTLDPTPSTLNPQP